MFAFGNFVFVIGKLDTQAVNFKKFLFSIKKFSTSLTKLYAC